MVDEQPLMEVEVYRGLEDVEFPVDDARFDKDDAETADDDAGLEN